MSAWLLKPEYPTALIFHLEDVRNRLAAYLAKISYPRDPFREIIHSLSRPAL